MPEAFSPAAYVLIHEKNKDQVLGQLEEFIRQGSAAKMSDTEKIILARVWLMAFAGAPNRGAFGGDKIVYSKGDAIARLKDHMAAYLVEETPEARLKLSYFVDFIDAVRRAPFPEGIDEKEKSTQPLKKE